MKMKQKYLKNAVILACVTMSSQVQAALPIDPVLNFNSGVQTCLLGAGTPPDNCTYVVVVETGSYFGMDTNGNGSVISSERTPLVTNDGLKIGSIQSASGTHSGAPDGTESPGIDQAWAFFANTGLHFTASNSSALSNNGTGSETIDMSGWRVTWNGIEAINMGSGAWEAYANNGNAVNPDGVGILTCGNTCEDGDTFVLEYSATVPLGDPSGFGGVAYNLYLEGTIGTFNTAPVTTNLATGVSSTGATPPGTAVSISLTANVTDADASDGLTSTNVDYTSLVISNPSANIASSCTPTAVVDNNDGTVTFPACPNGTYTFDFTFADGYETSNTSTVTVTASGDPAPNALNDSATVDGTTATVIDVLANDNDNNIDATSVVVVSAASNGGTSVNGTTGAITYTANAGFIGTDTFTYTVDDLVAQTSNVATVTVTVNALNTPASSATYAPGTTAQSAGSTTGIITIENIGVPDTGTFVEDDVAQTCIGGCFDFTLSGIAAGSSASVILPLSTPVPVKGDPGHTITYRKLLNGSWVNFDTTTDAINTAPGTVNGSDVSCPPATSSEYVGLTTGHSCLRLTITDGGPNDSDGLADGTITDPGGLAELYPISGTDGCSMSSSIVNANERADWWLVAGFLALLGLFRLKRTQV